MATTTASSSTNAEEALSEGQLRFEIPAVNLLSSILSLLNTNPTDPQVDKLISAFFQESTGEQELAASLLITTANDTAFLAFVRLLASRLASSSELILFLLVGLRKCFRLATLDRVARLLLAEVLLSELTSPRGPSWGALNILENVLVGSQHSPQLFFTSVPFLICSLESLAQTNAAKKLSALQRLVCCLLDLWRGNDAVLAPLERLVASARKELSQVQLRALQSAQHWLKTMGSDADDKAMPHSLFSSTWVGGEWDTSCGNVVLHATANIEANNALGFVYLCQPILLGPRPALDIGSKGLLMCQNYRYFPGTIVDAYRGLYKFRCESGGGTHWMPSELILHPDDCPLDVTKEIASPTQVLARSSYSSYYERGIVVQPQTSLEISDSKQARHAESLLVRFDSLRCEWVPRSKLYIAAHNLALTGTTTPHWFAASMNSFVYQPPDSDYPEMDGTLKPFNYSTRGTYSLTFCPAARVFSGRWNHGVYHAGHWLGVAYEPVISFNTAALLTDDNDSSSDGNAFTSARLFTFNGVDTLVDVCGNLFFSFAGQQCFTFETSLMLSDVVARKMVIFHKPDEHGLYVSEAGDLCYWRRVITSSTNSALITETLVSDADDRLRARQLYHVVVQYDGIHAWLIVNRKVVACNEMRPLTPPESLSQLSFGGDGLKENYLAGSLFNVKLWACVRRPEQLAAVSPGLEESDPLPSTLVGYWPMTGILPLIVDLTRYGNHGFVSSASHRGFASWQPIVLDHTLATIHGLFHSYSASRQLLLTGGARGRDDNGSIELPSHYGTTAGSVWNAQPLVLNPGFSLSVQLRLHTDAAADKHSFCLQIADVPAYQPMPLAVAFSPALLCQFVFEQDRYAVHVHSGKESLVESSGFRSAHHQDITDLSLEYTCLNNNVGRCSILINGLTVVTFSFGGFLNIGPDSGCFRWGLTAGELVSRAATLEHFEAFQLVNWRFESKCAESSPAHALDLEAYLLQLLEFERALKAENHEWKFLRAKWCEDVRAAKSVREAAALVRRLARSLNISDWRRDDKTKWNADCRRASTLVELVELLLSLEHVLGSKSFNGDWYSEKLLFFTNSMNTIRLNALNREQSDIVAGLARDTNRPVQLCRTALARNGYDLEKAREWLDNSQNLSGYEAENRRRAIARRVGEQESWSSRVPNRRSNQAQAQASSDATSASSSSSSSSWRGLWCSNRGITSFSDRGTIDGKITVGTFTPSGHLAGLLARSSEGAWRFVGAWTDNIYTLPQPCGFDFNQEGTAFTGWSNTDTIVNVWNGHRIDYSRPYAVGLVNTGNSCYQNSLLQALNTTTGLRNEILSGRFLVGQTSQAAWKLVDRMQTVFSKLTLSQRGAVDPEIKSLLVAPYNGGRQHDSFEFGTYLLDTLVEQLRPTPLNGMIERIYGGTQINVKKCLSCNEVSTRREDFTFLSVPFPSNYRPITSIQFVSGKYASIGAPPGYSRISANLNEGRTGAPYIYCCVRRDRLEAPITDIKIVTLEDASRLPAKIPEGWEAIDFDLNPDAKHHVFVLVRKSPTGSPITELAVTTDSTVPDGFKKIDVDLNSEAGGKYIYLCIKRTNSIKAIVPITCKSLKGARRRLPAGFDLLEVNMNMQGPRHVYLATTSGGVVPPLTSVEYLYDPDFLRVDELVTEQNYQEHLTSLEFFVALDNHRYLRCCRGHGCPIKLLDVFRAPHPPPRHGYEIIDLVPELVTPSLPAADVPAAEMQAAVDELHTWAITGSFQMENTDHLRFTVPEEDNEWTSILICSGTFSRLNGKVTGFLFENETKHVFRGTWSNSHWKNSQPFFLTFDESWSSFEGSATTGDTTESLTGLKIPADARPASTSSSFSSPPSPMLAGIPKPDEPFEYLYTDVMILRVGEEAPPGYEVLTWKPIALHDESTPEAQLGGHIYVRKIPVDQADGVAVIVDATIIYAEVEPLPEGYSAITTTPNGHDATLRCGSGDGRRLTLCIRKDTDGAKAARGLYVSFTWGDNIPPCYQRQMKTTDYGLDANLCTVERDILNKRNEYVYLLVWRDTRYAHAIAGEWETSFGKLTLCVDGKSRGRKLRAVYGTSGGNLISGVYLQKTREIFGTYRETNYLNSACCSFKFTENNWRQLTGTYVYGDKRGTWNGWKDSFLQIGLQKDYLCQWRQGREVFSVAGENNHIDSLFSQTFCPEMMAGSNRVSCTRCNDLRDTERYTCIARPPAHLIVTLKRFAYDYRSGRMDKLLNKVEFGPTLSFPPCPEDLVSAVFSTPEDHQLQLQNLYGLYAVVVHAGTKLDGGHYYTYARDPSSSRLDEEDDPENAPWCRYDDNHVTTTTWSTLKDHLWSSIDNSEYLLFYRRLDLPATEQPVHPSIPLATLNQVVQSNTEYLLQTSRRNSSLHLLQEIEVEARSKLGFSGDFQISADSRLSLEDLQADLDSSLSFAPPATLPPEYQAHVPTECPHCNRLLPAGQIAGHLIDDQTTCSFAIDWAPPPQQEPPNEESLSQADAPEEGGKLNDDLEEQEVTSSFNEFDCSPYLDDSPPQLSFHDEGTPLTDDLVDD